MKKPRNPRNRFKLKGKKQSVRGAKLHSKKNNRIINMMKPGRLNS